jgi:hypothetical protein
MERNFLLGEARKKVAQEHIPPRQMHSCLIDKICLFAKLPLMKCPHQIKSAKILCPRCHDYLCQILKINRSNVNTDSLKTLYQNARDVAACYSGCTDNNHSKSLTVFCKSCSAEDVLTRLRPTKEMLYAFILMFKRRPDLIKPPKDILKILFSLCSEMQHLACIYWSNSIHKISNNEFITAQQVGRAHFRRTTKITVIHVDNCIKGSRMIAMECAKNVYNWLPNSADLQLMEILDENILPQFIPNKMYQCSKSCHGLHNRYMTLFGQGYSPKSFAEWLSRGILAPAIHW